MIKLTNNEIEAANRAEVTALLIRLGYRVYRPEADCYGEDLIIRTPDGDLRAIQLKANPQVDCNRYGKIKSLWMLFPDPKKRTWFLVPHDELYEWVRSRHSHAPKWRNAWNYPTVSRKLGLFSERFLVTLPPEQIAQKKKVQLSC